MRSRSVLTCSASAGALLLSIAAVAQPALNDQPVGRTLTVPFDYTNASAGTFPLYYELGKPFDRSKPTVFAVVDGQQFYVRRNAVRSLQESLFGDGFNVVGIPGRGTEESLVGRIVRTGSPDWRLAWTFLRSDQWVEDIESVRRAVVGTQGRISLYGRSGGGLLVHQYLAKHGQWVSTAFTQAAVNRFIDAELGLSSDTFWTDIGRQEPDLQTTLLDALARHTDERSRIMLLLQRQNFFVPADSLASERKALIEAIAKWDDAALRRYSAQYQVEQILEAVGAPPIGVRLFELFAPVLTQRRLSGAARLDPDLDVGELFSAPLMKLLRDRQIAAPSMDLAALRRVAAQIYMLAGRFDHTADYRSQIALAARYPNSRLLLLADDHGFSQLQKSGLYASLVQSAVRHGIRGPRQDGIEERLAPLVYREY